MTAHLYLLLLISTLARPITNNPSTRRYAPHSSHLPPSLPPSQYSETARIISSNTPSIQAYKRKRQKAAALPGEQVAAKTSRSDENGSWILASVQAYHGETETYDVQDEDDITKLIRIPFTNVMRLGTGQVRERERSEAASGRFVVSYFGLVANTFSLVASLLVRSSLPAGGLPQGLRMHGDLPRDYLLLPCQGLQEPNLETRQVRLSEERRKAGAKR